MFARWDREESALQKRQWHVSRKRAHMKRSDWYIVYILSIMSGCLIWDGRKLAGLLVLLASVVILTVVDGFGIELK
jgi:hypothetical protein